MKWQSAAAWLSGIAALNVLGICPTASQQSGPKPSGTAYVVKVGGRVSARIRQEAFRVFPNVNYAEDIAVGTRRIWFAMDGGLLVYDKQAKTWRRFDLNRGLNGAEVKAVAVAPARDETAWFVTTGRERDGIWLGRVSLRSGQIAQYALPQGAKPIYPQSARLALAPDGIAVRVEGFGDALPSPLQQDYRFDLRRATFRPAPFPNSPTAAFRPNAAPETAGYYVESARFSGNSLYLLTEKAIVEADTRRKTTRIFPLPKEWPNTPWADRWRLTTRNGGTILEALVRVEPSYSQRMKTARKERVRRSEAAERLTWRLNRQTGQFEEMGRVWLRPLEFARLLRVKARQRHTLPLYQSWMPPIVASLAMDGPRVWLGGDFRIAAFDTRAHAYSTFDRLPDELELGRGGLGGWVIPRVEPRAGQVFVRVDDKKGYRLLLRRQTWADVVLPDTRRSSAPRQNVVLPASPEPNAPREKTWAHIGPENSRFRWLLGSGELTSPPTPHFPRPYTQIPAVMDKRTGRVRPITEAWGYHVYHVVLYPGGAWLLASTVAGWNQPTPRVLMRYDAASDTVSRYEDPTFSGETSTNFYGIDSAEIASLPNQALLAFTNYADPAKGKERTLLAYRRTEDKWTPVSVPDGYALYKVTAAPDVLLVTLERDQQHSFWAYLPKSNRLERLRLPERYAALDLYEVYPAGGDLWFSGRGLLRARADAVLPPASKSAQQPGADGTPETHDETKAETRHDAESGKAAP